MTDNSYINIHFLIVSISSYIIGSIPFAILISKFLKLEDPRNFGSRNPGTTNVLRTGNKIAAMLTLLGDMAKGFIAIKITGIIYGEIYPKLVNVSSIFVVLGHMYSIFSNFKGGKGIATFFGILIATNPLLSLFSAISWTLTAYIWKYSSLASITTIVIYTIHNFLVYKICGYDWKMLAYTLVLSIMLILKHKENIKRLINGTESRMII
ncbi:glycerol-3-phosphate acyltransferase PlsY [Candidatus Kinetoplastibacterium oncopeltii TCC290E]|uniref:Glycerol-3-phosphate acyltransferase n=1 Tax=Candidatus Kinetoplastidibacterium stringomonadis TCC290E TaxID=1208920 RepID=M1L6S9_9PROT|nr:glycerol-3-phosphate 1-O-acyltransferase PlsY [Candidatus Kinetoplastibacterium oncopeltii]AGF48268.1 glycerol-3-phosphate acyltransferase PlsY [Candidatus Kinetoplastibacterium oncopeltii TCC290E]